MSEIFIKLTIDGGKCISAEGCLTCVRVCPVGIFKQADDKTQIAINEANEDECTLCDLCLEQCPVQAIRVIFGGLQSPFDKLASY